MKSFNSIGEVSRIAGVPCHVLRYWERHFRTLKPARDARGNRLYTPRDVNEVLRIKELVYRRGFRIRGAQKYLREARSAQSASRKLKLLKEILAELKKVRAWLP